MMIRQNLSLSNLSIAIIRLMWTLLPWCAFIIWEILLEFVDGFLMSSARSLSMWFQACITVVFFCGACLTQLYRTCNEFKTMQLVCLLLVRFGKDKHITPVVHEFHWFPIEMRVHFKILLYTYNEIYEPAKPLWSGSQSMLVIPKNGTKGLVSENVLMLQRQCGMIYTVLIWRILLSRADWKLFLRFICTVCIVS